MASTPNISTITIAKDVFEQIIYSQQEIARKRSVRLSFRLAAQMSPSMHSSPHPCHRHRPLHSLRVVAIESTRYSSSTEVTVSPPVDAGKRSEDELNEPHLVPLSHVAPVALNCEPSFDVQYFLCASIPMRTPCTFLQALKDYMQAYQMSPTGTLPTQLSLYPRIKLAMPYF